MVLDYRLLAGAIKDFSPKHILHNPCNELCSSSNLRMMGSTPRYTANDLFQTRGIEMSRSSDRFSVRYITVRLKTEEL